MELALGTGAGWGCGGGGEPCPTDQALPTQTLSPSKTNPTLDTAAADSSSQPPGGGGSESMVPSALSSQLSASQPGSRVEKFEKFEKFTKTACFVLESQRPCGSAVAEQEKHRGHGKTQSISWNLLLVAVTPRLLKVSFRNPVLEE
uniref:Uncharacterized protein n=1 Tax=Zonotrichia albicollis TaxID=44394 RepID=A0A8D2MCA1_ZONAL